MWHFLAETTQQGATQGLNGRSTIRLPGRKRHADATPAKLLAAYPTPCPLNLQLHVHQTSNASPTRHFAFSRKSIRTFPCRGQDARTAARPKRIPPPEKERPWSSKHLNAATATRFSTRNTPPRCCGPNAPTAEAERIRTRPPAPPRRLVGIEREARPRDNATVLYPPTKAALVFQKN